MKKIIGLLFLCLFVLIGLLGIYIVDDGEEAVVLQFGKHHDTIVESGMKWHVPFIQTVWTENTQEVKRMEYGFRTTSEGDSSNISEYVEVDREALMITGDENLVSLETVIQFRIFNVEQFFFNVHNQYDTIAHAGAAAIRRVVASNDFDGVVTENRGGVEAEIHEHLQAILDSYEIGIQVTTVQLQDVNPPVEVQDSFHKVVGAREEMNAVINQAESYANQIIPQARGNAAEMIAKAEGHKAARVAEASGDTALFNELLQAYRLGEDVTKTRMYYEMMEEVLPHVEKYIIENNDGSTLQFLPLSNSKNAVDQ
ncbi:MULTISPECIES: FtsH protease activity modulator HflK [Bacillaceae]|uniref:Protein HflK n=1 Tax=Evansella alkalicola TaxID=745819 RepID=A0ABS6JNA1_9BACI|nr:MULTISPECIES: FtsH protease activity modulator HflK [Bacillaceae]MBU9720039.1 FtsH protease activity modulator HflK [Bacillus alkalicola]